MSDEMQMIGGASDAQAPHAQDDLSHDPIWGRLNRELCALGFRAWSYSAVPTCYAGSALSPLRLTTYPKEHVRACVEDNLYVESPGLSFALMHAQATEFSRVRAQAKTTRGLGVLLELNRRYDVTRGVVVPLRDTLGVTAVLAAAYDGSASQWEECWRESAPAIVSAARSFNAIILERYARSFARGFVPALTPRQRELVRYLACGCSAEEAADRMRVGIHTLNKHMAGAKRRMGARTSAQLVALALQWGMI